MKIKNMKLLYFISVAFAILFSCMSVNYNKKEFMDYINLAKKNNACKNVCYFNLENNPNSKVKWYEDQKLISIDSSFYIKYLKRDTDLNYPDKHRFLYLYKFIAEKNGLVLIAVAQRYEHSDQNAFIYLFTNTGEIVKKIKVASEMGSPLNYTSKKSTLINKERLEIYEYYFSNEETYNYVDSIKTVYQIKEDFTFERVSYDSTRTITK